MATFTAIDQTVRPGSISRMRGTMRRVVTPAWMLLLWGVLSPASAAITTIHYDFEDGALRGNPTAMQVPPRILIEPNGNRFMRITARPGDKESIPSAYDDRNRSTVEFTSFGQPLTTVKNRRQLYSVDLRFHGDTGSDGVVFELFQNAKPLGGYGTRDSRGPVIIFWRKDGRVQGRANYANETRWTAWDLGRIPAGQWHTYKIHAVWSDDPQVGHIAVFLDGVRKTLIRRAVNLGRDADWLPSLKLGMYGDWATGLIDVDNVIVRPW